MKIKNKTTTEQLLSRMKETSNFDHIIIGTSDDPRDNVFKEIAEKCDVDVFFGDQDDKLLRYKQICDEFGLYGVVIVDGDDVLCFPEVMDENATLLKTYNHDVIFWKNLPLGAASSALTKDSLSKVLKIKLESDTEVWGGYFTKSNMFDVYYASSENPLYNHPEIRMTMDYREDYDFLCEVFDRLYVENVPFSSQSLMHLLVNKERSLNDITVLAQKKYEENIAKAVPVKFIN